MEKNHKQHNQSKRMSIHLAFTPLSPLSIYNHSITKDIYNNKTGSKYKTDSIVWCFCKYINSRNYHRYHMNFLLFTFDSNLNECSKNSVRHRIVPTW